MILLAAHARPGRTGGPNPGAAVMGAIDQTTFYKQYGQRDNVVCLLVVTYPRKVPDITRLSALRCSQDPWLEQPSKRGQDASGSWVWHLEHIIAAAATWLRRCRWGAAPRGRPRPHPAHVCFAWPPAARDSAAAARSPPAPHTAPPPALKDIRFVVRWGTTARASSEKEAKFPCHCLVSSAAGLGVTHAEHRLVGFGHHQVQCSLAGACLEAGQGILPLVSRVCMLHVQLRQLVVQQLQEVRPCRMVHA